MKIAIMSDSHGALDRLEQAFTNIQKAGIKNVLHAGDFLEEGVVEIFAGFPDLNFFIAIGNNDVNQERLAELQKLPNVKIDEVVFAEFGKYKIAISHYDGVAEEKSRDSMTSCEERADEGINPAVDEAPKFLRGISALTPALSPGEREQKEVDIFIHGHTHRPALVRRGKSVMLNPGALCDDGYYLVLDLETMKGRRVFFSREITRDRFDF